MSFLTTTSTVMAILQVNLGYPVLIAVCVRCSRGEMYIGHNHPCVCLPLAAFPHYCTDPDVTWSSGRGCSLVVHYWVDLQSVHGLRSYGNIRRTLVTSLRPSLDMMT